MPLALIFATLVGCSTRNITPTINTAVDADAEYVVGDFCFCCHIAWDDSAVTVVPTNTLASGMQMSCDGKSVTFCQNDMTRSFPISNTTPFNPALVLYQVFSSLSVANTKKLEATIEYRGKTSVGSYVLTITKDGAPLSLSITDADISVSFI